MLIIIGASGFIGRHIYRECLSQKEEVLGTFFKDPGCQGFARFDMRSQSLEDLLKANSIDKKYVNAVILCGADASIDHCFRNRDSSYELNVIGTERILDEIKQIGAKAVFFSSEAVFDGKRGFYNESDLVCPITEYGRQKAEVERYIEKNFKRYLVFRVSRAVGHEFGEKDIFHEFHRKIMRGEEIACLKNQTFSLTLADDIARVVLLAIRKGLCGLFHSSNSSMISRYGLAMKYVDMFFPAYPEVHEYAYEELPFADRRHIVNGLDGGMLSRKLNYRYQDVDEILQSYRISYEYHKAMRNV